MGASCCPPDDTDTNPKKQTDSNASPNSKRKPKQTGEVNPFSHSRSERIIQNEDGKLQKAPYKPPSNPNEVQNQGDAQSLVSYSIMNAQKDDLDARQSKPVQNSFQQTTLVYNSNADEQLSFQPNPILPIKKTNNGMAETFGEQNMLDVPVGSMYGRGGLDNEGSFNLKSYESKPVDSGQMRNSYSPQD